MSKNFKTLTKAEEQIMPAFWELRQAFGEDVVEKLPEPKLTILKYWKKLSTAIILWSETGFCTKENMIN